MYQVRTKDTHTYMKFKKIKSHNQNPKHKHALTLTTQQVLSWAMKSLIFF